MIVIKDLQATVLIATRDSSQAFEMLYAQSEQLLKERDEAEARAEAYRKIALKEWAEEKQLDAEARRILEGRASTSKAVGPKDPPKKGAEC